MSITTEIRLIVKGVKNGKEFVEYPRALNGRKLAEEHRDRLLAQTGLPDWQPNIISVEIQTREVSDWVGEGAQYSAVAHEPTDLESGRS